MTGNDFKQAILDGIPDPLPAPQPLDPKILRTHWLSLDELRTRPLRSPMVLRCFEDYLAGRRYPLSLCTDLTGTP